MKKILILFMVFLTISFVAAVNLNVQKISSNEVMIQGLSNPAQFVINITNNGESGFFSFYTFFGSGLTPTKPIKIESKQTKLILLKIFPRLDLNRSGFYSFNYFIQGKDKSEAKENLIVKIIPLKEAFEVGSQSINPESNTLNVYIKNKVNFNFSNINVTFKSPFFYLEKNVSLGPYKEKEFTINLKKEDFNKLMAGFYTINSNIEVEGLKTNVDGKIEFLKKDLLNTETKKYGLIISTKVIRKLNEGNTIINSITTIKKNILSRVFTSFTPTPNLVNREGTNVYYTWYSSINPGEDFEITIKTNWLFPFLIILFIILIIIFSKKYSNEDLLLRKRVAFVKLKEENLH